MVLGYSQMKISARVGLKPKYRSLIYCEWLAINAHSPDQAKLPYTTHCQHLLVRDPKPREGQVLMF